MSLNIAASVHARLLAHARKVGDEFNLVLTRYAVERFLYRLSISDSRTQFCLKGAQLFHVWFDEPHRPTRDADFLGSGPADEQLLLTRLREVVTIEVPDGIAFDPNGIQIEDIRQAARYGGFRARVPGRLGTARCPVLLDFGFGDAIVPGPEEVVYPTLLVDQPAPTVMVYPRSTVVAEKLEAIVHLGMGNSRMKDYFDLLTLVREGELELLLVAAAIVATFERRGTALPKSVPLGLTDEFASDGSKQAQWTGFLRKNALSGVALAEVVGEIRTFAGEAFRLARGGIE